MNSNSFYYSIAPQVYDDQFWWKRDDVEFWKKVLHPSSSSILELAAGTGRLAVPLINEGFDYNGLEISKDYCDYANKKFSHCSSSKILLGDMRSFQLNNKFDKIFIPFNSLLHLLKEIDLISTLQCIKQHMHNQSELYIDIFVPHHSYLFNNNIPQKRIEFFNSSNNKETIIKECLSYNDESEIVTVVWDYECQNKKYNQFTFDMKIYYPDTMNRILIEQGFKILNLWGDYNQSTFSLESPLQIYKCIND